MGIERGGIKMNIIKKIKGTTVEEKVLWATGAVMLTSLVAGYKWIIFAYIFYGALFMFAGEALALLTQAHSKSNKEMVDKNEQ